MIDARYAAVVAGGTPLDRPEDIEISPITGDIVIALTNNYPKEVYFGSLLKISEKNNDPLALEFEAQNLISGGLESGFACPDNLEFDQNGNLWFTTDMSDEEMNKGRYAPFKNNGLFVVMMNGSQAGKPQQIASGPTDAELTGLKFTPDYKSLFISVQHPGAQTKDLKNPTSHWPDGGDSLPAPAVVQISGEALEKIARRKS
jgi:secreted PhoX family phosphatase